MLEELKLMEHLLDFLHAFVLLLRRLDNEPSPPLDSFVKVGDERLQTDILFEALPVKARELFLDSFESPLLASLLLLGSSCLFLLSSQGSLFFDLVLLTLARVVVLECR